MHNAHTTEAEKIWYTFCIYFFMNTDSNIHQKRGWKGVIITLFILMLLGVFTWRVVFFANQIRREGTDLSALNFSQTVSTITRLATQPVTDEVFDVVLENRPSLGNKDAPLTIVEFADFGCPYSRTASFILRTLATNYPNQLYYIYRDFPLIEIHPLAQKASEASACAHEQGKFWEFHDKLYQNQTSLDEGSFEKFAQQLNLDVPAFQECFASQKYTKQVEQDLEDGLRAGVRGTPTFFLNGNRIPGVIPQTVLESVIQSVSKQEK